MAAIPDFDAGAMENWGLVTYRETAILYDEATSSAANKRSICTTIAHELAHQWTGDLVTMEWWSYLWLNEGFATFLETLGGNAIEPDFGLIDTFVLDNNHDVMSSDALESSVPLSRQVDDANGPIFGSVTYSKGASVIRMMNYIVTSETFRLGLSNYIKTFAYSNTNPDDLFNSLTVQAHEDGTLSADFTMKQIMDTWTLQMGYPVVTVTRDYAANTATVSQERFLLVNSGSSNDTHDYIWWVPLTLTDQTSPNFENTKPSDWLEEEREKTISGLPDENSWVIFNIQEMGYYRVNYDQRNWELLFAQLEENQEVIHIINRAQIINDAMNLAQGHELDYSIALSSTKFLKNEGQYIPWNAALNTLTYIKDMFVSSGGYDRFRDYTLDLLNPIYNNVTFIEDPNENILRSLLRTDVLSWACDLDLRDCLVNSLVLFNDWRGEVNPDLNNPISVNLKSVVYCNGIKQGSVEEWDFAWERYLAANVGSERTTLISALGCSRETWVLNRYLEWSINETTGIRKQDASRVFSSVSNNPAGQPIAFNFLINRWDDLVIYYGAVRSVTELLPSVVSTMNTQQDLEELIRLRDEHADEVETYMDQSIEQVRLNIQWMDENYATVLEWLEANRPSRRS